MSELISKTEVIDDLKKDIAESDNWLEIAMYLAFTVRIMAYKNIDAVEVVRCKDCINFNKYEDCDVPNAFCSDGERREDNEQIH